MKKILLVNSKYTEFGGENSNFEEEKIFFDKKYQVSSLEFSNTNSPKFVDILGFLFSTNLNSNKIFKKRLQEFNPDIIYIHNLWFKGNLGILNIANKHNSKKIIKIHNYRPICTKSFFISKHLGKFDNCPMCNLNKQSKFSIFNKYYKNSFLKSFLLVIHSKRFLFLLKKLNLTIFCLSTFQKQILINHGIDAHKIKIFSNPSLENKINFHNYKSNVFTYAGKIDDSKGVEDLLKTWIELEMTNCNLYIVGSGTKLEFLKSKYNYNNIKFFGQLRNEQVVEIIKNSRAVVTATKLFEGQPKFLMEASSLGIPSIFPEFGGMGEFFPNNYDFKFVQNDYDSLKKVFKLSLIDDEIKSQSEIVFKFYMDNFSKKHLHHKFTDYLNS